MWELKFDSNNLEAISYPDLAVLNNLEYLNLENNSIFSIDIFKCWSRSAHIKIYSTS